MVFSHVCQVKFSKFRGFTWYFCRFLARSLQYNRYNNHCACISSAPADEAFFKDSPTKKTTPTRYFIEVEIIYIFFFPGCSLARDLQYIPVKGLYKVCVGGQT